MTPMDTHPYHSDVPLVEPRLLALLGERIANLVSIIEQVPTLEGEPRHTRSCALGALDRLGLQLQQLCRMVGHRGAPLTEVTDLLTVCRLAATEWQARADGAHVQLSVEGSSLATESNVAALSQTLDLLIEYGLECGEHVVLGVQRVGLTEQPTLRVDISLRHVAAPTAAAPRPEIDALLPMLAALLARGTGMRLRQSVAGKTVTLQLAIPQIPTDSPFSPDDGLLPRTPVAVGYRILIVDPNTASRLKAHQLLTEAGMLADAVENVPQARAALRDGPPGVLVSGLPTHEADMADLVHDMRAACPTLRVIELVDAANAFAFSMPAADAPGRLSRDELEAHLTTAVSEEIYGARAE